MRRRNSWQMSLLSTGLVVSALGAIGCGGGGSMTTGMGGMGGTTETTIELFSWWIAPGEAEALQALIDLNRANHPNQRIFNAGAVSGMDVRATLAARLANNDPPDLFQQNAHDLRTFLAANPGSLAQLDSLFAAQGLNTAVLPEILSNVTVDGHIYSMPVNIHRENTLFYNKQIFAAHNLQPPTTVTELLQVCSTLKAAGVTPIATAHQGWILRIMFNTVAMGVMGADAFHDYMTGGPRDDVALADAIDVFGDILADDVNASASNADFGWTNAAGEVAAGRAAMFMHGDWAKGYYVQLGWTPGVDFGVIGAPGASDLFWYGVDLFSLPAGAPHATEARDFLTTVGSTAGQVAFNKLKGSSPIRTDVPLNQLDPEARATLTDLMNARYRMLVVNHDAWDMAFVAFAQNGDRAALFQAYVDNPPVQ
jgi:glucose/mannose transport system substrate-binding protein